MTTGLATSQSAAEPSQALPVMSSTLSQSQSSESHSGGVVSEVIQAGYETARVDLTVPVPFRTMTIDTNPAVARRVLRASAVTLGLALGTLAAPALAAPPDTDTWEQSDSGALINDLLFLIGVPVLVFVVLALLVYLPSMVRRQSSEPALAFGERPEWFGGPRKGVDSAAGDDGNEERASDKGGASARW